MKLVLRIINADDLLAEPDRKRVWVREGGSIGRITGNDWVLPDPRSEISRVHARIHFENDLYYIEDLSTNGVFVGDLDHRIERVPHAIDDGDQLFIGHYQIAVELVDEERASDPAFNSSYDSSAHSKPKSSPVIGNASDHFSDQRPHNAIQPVDSFAVNDFSSTKPSAPSPNSVIPEDWLSGSVDSVLADWSSPDSVVPNVDSFIDVLEEAPKKQSELPQKVSSLQKVVPSASDELVNANNHSSSKHAAAQKAAFTETLKTVLASFDIDYVNCVMMEKGETQEDLIQRLFDDVFYKHYQQRLSEYKK